MVDKLVEECNETIDEEVKPATITPVENNYKQNSCIVYIVLFPIFLTINVVNGAYFSYYKYKNRNKKMFLDMIMFIKQKFTKLINEKSQTN